MFSISSIEFEFSINIKISSSFNSLLLFPLLVICSSNTFLIVSFFSFANCFSSFSLLIIFTKLKSDILKLFILFIIFFFSSSLSRLLFSGNCLILFSMSSKKGLYLFITVLISSFLLLGVFPSPNFFYVIILCFFIFFYAFKMPSNIYKE